jgi:hypothetical protein
MLLNDAGSGQHFANLTGGPSPLRPLGNMKSLCCEYRETLFMAG